MDIIPREQYSVGDVNMDGIVDIRDATAIQRAVAGIEPLADHLTVLADTNNDGAVTIDDATVIQKVIARIETAESVIGTLVFVNTP